MKEIKNYTNEELLLKLKNVIQEEGIVLLSEVQASKILSSYYKSFPLNTHNKIKEQYKVLRYAAMERNLNVPLEWYNVEYTEKDVIDRINEVKNLIIYNICKNAENKEKAVLEINKTNEFFRDIIDIEINKTKVIDVNFKKKRKSI